MAPGVDVRANGGQIVGPGSIHPGGGLYEIQIGPDDCGIAVAPVGPEYSCGLPKIVMV